MISNIYHIYLLLTYTFRSKHATQIGTTSNKKVLRWSRIAIDTHIHTRMTCMTFAPYLDITDAQMAHQSVLLWHGALSIPLGPC